MAKFTIVKSAPEKLEKGEIVINPPTFLEQIQENVRKAPRNQQTAINHMREILQSIAVKYDPEMNVMKFKLVNYEGVPYANNEELALIILRILKTEYPIVLDKYLEHELKNRPINTKLVYYTGDFNSTGPFYKAGLDLLEEKDLDSFLTGKPKRVVGKPAITKEQAEAKNEENT